MYYLEFLSKEDVTLLLSVCTYIFNYLYQYELMDICFILWVVI